MKFNKSVFIFCAAALLVAAGIFLACSVPHGLPASSQQQSISAIAATEPSDSSHTGSSPDMKTDTSQAGADAISHLLRAEDYDDAIQDGQVALQSSPADIDLQQKLADAYIGRAWFYKSKRLTTYTLADLSRALEVAPGYYRAHYEMGRFHNNQWQFSIGLTDLNKALALKPDFEPAYVERAYSYYKNQKWEQALQDVKQAIELDPADRQTYRMRGLVHVATGKPDLALEDVNRAIAMDTMDAQSYYYRSLVYTSMGKVDLAIADLQTTLKLSDDDMLTARANVDCQALTQNLKH